ncbi:MAG: hypothetical protein ACX933_07740 [Marinobacter adhaerens]
MYRKPGFARVKLECCNLIRLQKLTNLEKEWEAILKATFSLLGFLIASNTYAATVWEHLSSGDGTAFEQRWVVSSPIVGMSTNKQLASDMILGATLEGDSGLAVFLNHASSKICKFSDWKLAVDQTVIPIKAELSENTDQTLLVPEEQAWARELLVLFRDGKRIAVQFHANCFNFLYLKYVGSVTLTFSLDGSQKALEFLNATP